MSRTVNGTCTPKKKPDEMCWEVREGIGGMLIGPPNEHWAAVAHTKEDAERIVECINAYANVKPSREQWLYHTGREHGRAEMRVKIADLVNACKKFISSWLDGKLISPEESALVGAFSKVMQEKMCPACGKEPRRLHLNGDCP